MFKFYKIIVNVPSNHDDTNKWTRAVSKTSPPPPSCLYVRLSNWLACLVGVQWLLVQ